MEGTEKQVKWAIDIRTKKIEEMNTHLENLLKTPNIPKEQSEKLKNQTENMTTAWLAISDAKFWINNRNCFWQTIAKEILETNKK